MYDIALRDSVRVFCHRQTVFVCIQIRGLKMYLMTAALPYQSAALCGQWKSMVPHSATWGPPHFICHNRSIRQWAQTTARFSQESIGERGGCEIFWAIVNFSISKRHCAVSKTTYSGSLSFIDNSFIHLLCLASVPCNFTCMIFPWWIQCFFFFFCLHFSSSSHRSLWALIDISWVTFSFTLTLMSAALSDAQVVLCFIRPHSLLSYVSLCYSSLLPVLWKSSFPLLNPYSLIWETPRPRRLCSGRRERMEMAAPSGRGQARLSGVCSRLLEESIYCATAQTLVITHGFSSDYCTPGIKDGSRTTWQPVAENQFKIHRPIHSKSTYTSTTHSDQK